MVVKFYISENIDRREKGFKNPAERECSLQISRLIWRRYREYPGIYAVLFNIEQPPADIIVISNNGIGVADLKDISGSISGHEKSTWVSKSLDGRSHRILAGSHKNPFIQIRQYRADIKEELKRLGSFLPGKPKWLLSGDFDVQASVVITGGTYDIEYLDLDPSATGSWFTIRDPSNVTDWVYSLSFKGLNQYDPYQLKSSQVETLAMIGFHTREWSEMENMLTNEEPFAYLWHCENNGTIKSRYALIERNTHIGRDSAAYIQIEDNRIGKHHATIKCKIEGVFLIDENSKNGVYVNGAKVDRQHILQDQDEIVLGPYDEKSGTSSIDGSYFLYTIEDKRNVSTELWSGIE